KPNVTPLTLPSPTAWTMGGLALLTTAPTPFAASPMPMLVLSPFAVQVTAPGVALFAPSTTTCGPAGDEAELDELAFVLDLLLEQPAKPATTMTRPATPTMIPRFTNALLYVAGVYVAGVALRRVVARSKLSGPLTDRDRGPTFMTPFGG